MKNLKFFNAHILSNNSIRYDSTSSIRRPSKGVFRFINPKTKYLPYYMFNFNCGGILHKSLSTTSSFNSSYQNHLILFNIIKTQVNHTTKLLFSTSHISETDKRLIIEKCQKDIENWMQRDIPDLSLPVYNSFYYAPIVNRGLASYDSETDDQFYWGEILLCDVRHPIVGAKYYIEGKEKLESKVLVALTMDKDYFNQAYYNMIVEEPSDPSKFKLILDDVWFRNLPKASKKYKQINELRENCIKDGIDIIDSEGYFDEVYVTNKDEKGLNPMQKVQKVRKFKEDFIEYLSSKYGDKNKKSLVKLDTSSNPESKTSTNSVEDTDESLYSQVTSDTRHSYNTFTVDMLREAVRNIAEERPEFVTEYITPIPQEQEEEEDEDDW